MYNTLQKILTKLLRYGYAVHADSNTISWGQWGDGLAVTVSYVIFTSVTSVLGSWCDLDPDLDLP